MPPEKLEPNILTYIYILYRLYACICMHVYQRMEALGCVIMSESTYTHYIVLLFNLPKSIELFFNRHNQAFVATKGGSTTEMSPGMRS